MRLVEESRVQACHLQNLAHCPRYNSQPLYRAEGLRCHVNIWEMSRTMPRSVWEYFVLFGGWCFRTIVNETGKITSFKTTTGKKRSTTVVPSFPEFHLSKEEKQAGRWKKWLPRFRNFTRPQTLSLHFTGETVNEIFDELPNNTAIADENPFERAYKLLHTAAKPWARGLHITTSKTSSLNSQS